MLQIDRNSGLPLYLQVRDLVDERIASGQIGPDGRLPTERELAHELGVSRNTVVSAYRQLEKEGIIHSQQGKGTFANRPKGEGKGGRQGRVQRIIDMAIDEALDSGFTLDQFAALAHVAVRERDAQLRRFRLLFVDCNAEHLNAFADQVRPQTNVHIDTILLPDLLAAAKPHPLVRDADLVVTTVRHEPDVRRSIGPKTDLLAVSTSPSMEAMIQLARLPGDAKVLLISTTEEFWDIVRPSLEQAGLAALEIDYTVETETDALGETVGSHTAVVVSADRYAQILPIAHAAGVAEVIPFQYEFDQASLHLIHTRIMELRDQCGKNPAPQRT